jgi:hypothetical protein
MKKVLLIIALSFLSCAAPMKLTQEESNYLERVRSVSIPFVMSKADAIDGWGRAISWIGLYSSMKLQTTNEYAIQTFNPMGGNIFVPVYGYYITKAPSGDNVTITVECLTHPAGIAEDNAWLNSQILAHYMQSGEIVPRLIKR